MSSSILDASPTRATRASALAGVGGAAAHGLVAFLVLAGAGVAHRAAQSLAVTEMVEVDLPPPPPEPELEPPKPTTPPPVRVRSAPQDPPPVEKPAAAAVAGQVLTANEALDFGNTFVTGSGTGYAGGVTDALGTSTQAVRSSSARGTGSPAPPPLAPPPPPLNHARPPALAGGVRWDCPFPPEADDAGIDHAVVALSVEVSAAGEVRAAKARADPGFGFATVARRCAMNKRWTPGLDRDGKPAAATALVNVRFDR